MNNMCLDTDSNLGTYFQLMHNNNNNNEVIFSFYSLQFYFSRDISNNSCEMF